MRTSKQIILALLVVEIYLGEGPTSHHSLGHDDAYKAITSCMIQPVRWHGWLTAFRGSFQAAAVHLLQYVFVAPLHHHLPVRPTVVCCLLFAVFWLQPNKFGICLLLRHVDMNTIWNNKDTEHLKFNHY